MSDPRPTRRVHPVTILVKAVTNLPFLGLAWFFFVDRLIPVSAMPLLGVLVVLSAVSLGFAYLSYTRVRFGFDADGDFRLNSGVVFQRQQRLALSRLQSVDIMRPVLARVFGMASVRIEAAGDAAIVVEYLPEAQAQALRQEVLDRAGGKGESEALPAPEEYLLHVPTRDLLVSLLLDHTTMIAMAVAVIGATVVVVLTGPAGILAYGLGVFVPLATAFSAFTNWYDFTLARSTDGARMRSGLLSTRAQTVPPGRVHAIEVSQPLLWRRRDWVRVSMSIAGTGTNERENAFAKVLIPVARRDDAMDIIGKVLPNWRTEGMDFAPAPATASRRAWLQHRQLGVAVTPDMLITRRGRFVRRIAIVPHGRVQSVRLVQGPWQRALGLASVRADTVPGAVHVWALHRDARQARELADTESRLMRQARAAAGPERWLASRDEQAPQ